MKYHYSLEGPFWQIQDDSEILQCTLLGQAIPSPQQAEVFK